MFLNSTISNMRSCFGFTVVTFEFCCGVFKLITLPNLRSCLRIRFLVVFFWFCHLLRISCRVSELAVMVFGFNVMLLVLHGFFFFFALLVCFALKDM